MRPSPPVWPRPTCGRERRAEHRDASPGGMRPRQTVGQPEQLPSSRLPRCGSFTHPLESHPLLSACAVSTGGRPPRCAHPPVLKPPHDDEHRRREENGDAYRGQHAREHADADRPSGIGAGAFGRHRRHDAENECERRHAIGRERSFAASTAESVIDCPASRSSRANSTISAIRKTRPIWCRDCSRC